MTRILDGWAPLQSPTIRHVARNTALESLFALAESMGAKRQEIIRQVGLDPELAVRVGADIPASQLQDVHACAARLAGRPDFGLVWAATNSRRHLGPLNILLENCRSMREAIEVGVRFVHLHNTSARYTVVSGRERDRLRLEVLAAGQFPAAPYVESCLAGMVFLWRSMMGPDWMPREIWFEHERQGSPADYQRAFGCPVLFGQSQNCVVAPKADFDARITGRDTRVKSFMESMLDELDRVYADDMLAKVRLILLGLIPAGRATTAETARRLGMPSRTMQRRLAIHGTSLREMVTEERVRMAREYLAREDATVTGLVPILGLSEVSAVSRFLKDHGIQVHRRNTAQEKTARMLLTE